MRLLLPSAKLIIPPLATPLHCFALWLQYAEMEMRHRFVNHARNVWDRAVTYLPRQDQLWYKYVHMEEMLGNTAGARAVFDRWMKWEPDHQAWMAYVKVSDQGGNKEGLRNFGALGCFSRHCKVWGLVLTLESWAGLLD
jgi:hypothetical protein